MDSKELIIGFLNKTFHREFESIKEIRNRNIIYYSVDEKISFEVSNEFLMDSVTEKCDLEMKLERAFKNNNCVMGKEYIISPYGIITEK
ncbi:hypothetical protein V3429_02265 [Aeromonas jandaei]|uniref:hypothetical protein n=1 Tax=Aeromonas jandaei TaxID=650 RepID=UPI0030CA6354